MSALGFGFFLGSFPAIIPASKAFSDYNRDFHGLMVGALMLIGVLGWIFLPSLWGAVDFVIGIALLPFSIWALRHRKITEFGAHLAREREEEAHRAAEKKAEENEIRARALRDKDKWMQMYQKEGWKYISQAVMMNTQEKPDCIVMLSENSILLKICEYKIDKGFSPLSHIVINVNQVIGLNTARPNITKNRIKNIPVAIVENEPKNTKSPVLRGLVGGALLGPVGVVLGAASGINSEDSKISTTIQNQNVVEYYETQGEQQLIIGTSLPERPVLKLKFEPPSLADEWMYRIRGAQNRRG